jgi:hypothetical protein
MSANDPKIASLRAQVDAAHEEFNLAVMFHEAWKPTAYDAQLHERMGRSYATNTFQVIRLALKREMLLALARLWDKPSNALRMEESIGAPLRNAQVIAALAEERAANIGIAGVEDQIRKELGEKARAVVMLVEKYSKGGSHFSVRDHLKTLRDERLAHRQVSTAKAPETSVTDREIEEFYQDNSKLLSLLLGLVKATAYDPMEAADVYAHYAKFFWMGVSGERTTGHPNYRPPPQAA